MSPDNPVIYYCDNGNKCFEIWYQNTKYHRIDGPGLIKYDENGNKLIEVWYQDGEVHRIDGPGIIKYDNGNKKCEIWYQNGKYHRLDGPAFIRYNVQGDIINKEYFLLSKELSRKQYHKILYILNNKISAFRQRKRNEIYRVLKKSDLLSKIGSDMCNAVTHYVY